MVSVMKGTRAEILDILASEPDATYGDIARRVGVSKQRVHQIAKGAGKAGRNTGSVLGHLIEYKCWHNMISRCADPDHSGYRHYGGRGIRVCDRWMNSFAAFLLDMGPRPSPDLSLDRINNDGDYEPSNCRWATPEQQQANKRQQTTWRGKPVKPKRRKRDVPGRPPVDFSPDQIEFARREWYDLRHKTNGAALKAIQRKVPKWTLARCYDKALGFGPSGRGK